MRYVFLGWLLFAALDIGLTLAVGSRVAAIDGKLWSEIAEALNHENR